MDDDMVYHPQMNMGKNVEHLLSIVIINKGKQLMQINDQNVIILVIFPCLVFPGTPTSVTPDGRTKSYG